MVITGPAVYATHLHAPPSDVTWSEAWRLQTRHDAPAGPDRINGRLYLARIESAADGRQVLAQIEVDDLMVADARRAGLPEGLGHDGTVIAVCPPGTTAGQARWVLRMLARKAVRDLPVPIRTPNQRALWRHTADVLLDVLAVNPVLTAGLR